MFAVFRLHSVRNSMLRADRWADCPRSPTATRASRARQMPIQQERYVRKRLDANDLVGLKLSPDPMFDCQYQPHVGEAVPALEVPDPRIVGNSRAIGAGSLREQSSG